MAKHSYVRWKILWSIIVMLIISSMNVVGDEDSEQEMSARDKEIKQDEEELIARIEKLKKMCQIEIEKGTVRSMDECKANLQNDLNSVGTPKTSKGIVSLFHNLILFSG